MISTSLLSSFHRPGKTSGQTGATDPARRATKSRPLLRAIIHALPIGAGFQHLMGFRQQDYEVTQNGLVVERDELISSIDDRRYGVGRLSMPNLEELRARVSVPSGKRSTVRYVVEDIRVLHAKPKL